MRILLIEDEPELRKDLISGLSLQGYAVDGAQDGGSGYQKACDEEYDLIILDLNLPGMSGLELLRKLQTDQQQQKVLILSADHQLDSKLSGFRLGASDYLTKPFHFAELQARIRVLLNRQFIQKSNQLSYGGLIMDTSSRITHANGQPLSLTAKEGAILEYFLQNCGRLITQQELIDHVWNDDFDPFSNVLRVHLSALRKKLRNGLGEDPIKTKIGEGYLLP